MRSLKGFTHALLSTVVFFAVQSIPAHGLQPPSPELVGSLTKGLSITPHQATGGAGTLFALAKSRLSPADFGKISAAVPGMSSFLHAAPATSGGSDLASLAGSLGGSSMGALASAATGFQKLGLSPSMVQKFLPIVTSFLQSKGGAGLASLFSSALK